MGCWGVLVAAALGALWMAGAVELSRLPPPPGLPPSEAVPHARRSRPIARSSAIAVVPLPSGVRPFEGFAHPAQPQQQPQPPLPPPPPPPPTPPDAVVSSVDPSEVVVVEPEGGGAGPEWPQPSPWTPSPDEGHGGGAAPTTFYQQPLGADGSYEFHRHHMAITNKVLSRYWKTGIWARIRYEGADGLWRRERGYLRPPLGAEAPVLVKEGAYTFRDAAGLLCRVDYVADEGGFRSAASPVQGDTMHEIP